VASSAIHRMLEVLATLTSLHDLIVRDTHALDVKNKDHLQKRIQILASTTKVSFAAQALIKDRNQFLLEINCEAKARQSTKSLVLGKAKVMSFEDLKEPRVKRAEKKHALVSKPKRGSRGRPGCKRKSDAKGRLITEGPNRKLPRYTGCPGTQG
jgi:hypothetical protein